jgi:hypothetical protein
LIFRRTKHAGQSTEQSDFAQVEQIEFRSLAAAIASSFQMNGSLTKQTQAAV